MLYSSAFWRPSPVHSRRLSSWPRNILLLTLLSVVAYLGARLWCCRASRPTSHIQEIVLRFKLSTLTKVTMYQLQTPSSMPEQGVGFRTNTPGAYVVPQWETCQTTGAQCLLDYTNTLDLTPVTPPRECLLGSIPPYFVRSFFDYYISVGSDTRFRSMYNLKTMFAQRLTSLNVSRYR